MGPTPLVSAHSAIPRPAAPASCPRCATESHTTRPSVHSVASAHWRVSQIGAVSFCRRKSQVTLQCPELRLVENPGPATFPISSSKLHSRRAVHSVVCAASTGASAPNPPSYSSGAFIGKLGSDSAATRAAASAARGPPQGAVVLDARVVFATLALAIGVPLVAGVLVSLYANPLQDWYRGLRRPVWEPPDWLFGAVWSLLYALMGLASWLVWADGGWAKQSQVLKLYIAQLLVNLSWPIVFFQGHSLAGGVLVLVALDVLVLWTMRAFHSVNRVAGWLMLPYFAWAIFATFLNMVIWHMNRDIRSSDTGSGVTWSTARRPDTRDGYSEW